jgi:hypothetical protein
VFDHHGRQLSAWTYFAIPEDGDSVPHRSYIDLYIKGAAYFGLPGPYLESLKQIKDHARSD